MREILFRGKRTDNGKWVTGYLFIDADLEMYMIQGFNYYYDENGLQREYFSVNVDPKTVGQYTGLTDKNGRKIFEGDIIKHYIKNSEIVKTYIVEWESRLTKFVGRYMGDEYYGHKYAYAEIHEELIYEVIGNIHDNPEILNKN